MLSVFDLLVMHPLVADLPAGWLHRIALHARPVHHVSGFRLFREDGPADRLWLVHSGDVAVDLHVPGRGDVVVEHLGPGSTVGWSWLLPPYRYRFGAIVAEDIRAVEIDAAHARSLISGDAELGRELESRLLAVVADRLLAARNRLVELYAYPGDERP